MGFEKQAIKATYISIAGNTFLAIIKALTGYFGNSYALIADAIESTSDIFSSALVLFGIKYASRPADRNHPYGHGRAEPLITFVVVVILVSSAVVIALQSIRNIQTPHDLPKPYTLIVLLGIIGVKEMFYRFVKKKGQETHSSALQADAWHHRSDALTSLAAFFGIAFALWMGKGYESADDWAALLASFIILFNSYLIFRPALGEMMDEQLYEPMVEKIRLLAVEVNGVLETEKCHVRKTGMTYHVDLHIVVDANISVRDGHNIAHVLKDYLKNHLKQIADVHIHVEPKD
jgi:cation diffusion facilitator family transporter